MRRVQGEIRDHQGCRDWADRSLRFTTLIRAVPPMCVLGLPMLRRRKSSVIRRIEDDAAYVNVCFLRRLRWFLVVLD